MSGLSEPIFISCSREDSEYVDRLIESLHAAGVDTWTDKSISFGSSFRKEITDAIEGCRACVVIMSPASEASSEVEAEVEWALREQKPILPVLLGGRGLLPLITRQHVDARDGSLPSQEWIAHLREAGV